MMSDLDDLCKASDRPLRDCIVHLMQEGIESYGGEYADDIRNHRATAWLFCLEAKEVGLTPDEALKEINSFVLDRCKPPVHPKDLESIMKLVDYVYRPGKVTSLSCKSKLFNGESFKEISIDHPICHFAEKGERCAYREWEEEQAGLEWMTVLKQFSKKGWSEFLQNRFRGCGRIASEVFRVLVNRAVINRIQPGGTILIGLRGIRTEIANHNKGALSSLTPTDIKRSINLLVRCGLVRISVRGVVGENSRKSNGYVIHASLPCIATDLDETRVANETCLTHQPKTQQSDTHSAHNELTQYEYQSGRRDE